MVDKRKVNKKKFRERHKHPYSQKEILEYYNAIYRSYLSIISQKPAAILAPLRGSEPLMKSINLIASLERKSSEIPRTYYPRIGQLNQNVNTTKVVDKAPPSFAPSPSQKAQYRETKRSIERIIKNHIKNSKNSRKKPIKITIIDEVQRGGSLTQFTNMVEKILSEKRNKYRINFNVISIAETGKKRCPEYIHLKQISNVKEFKVARLFTTDSPKFLFPLTKKREWLWPFREIVKLAITRKAIKGRHELMSDLTAEHVKKRNNQQFRMNLNTAKKRISRLPR